MNLTCHACGKTGWADIVGGQERRFRFTCPSITCRADLGPVKQESLPEPSPVLTSTPTFAAPVTLPALIVQGHADPIDTLRARLAVVEVRIAELPPLKAERQYLRRVLAAVDRRPREPRSNVVPIARKAAQ